jgi:molecular chaperone GrpE
MIIGIFGEDMSVPNEKNDSAEPEQAEASDGLEMLVKALREDLVGEQKKSSDLSKRIMYLQADIINLQKQAEREIAEARESVSARYLLELVSVKEDLERAISLGSEKSQKSIVDGLKVLLSRVDSTLRMNDVERIEISAETKFDHRIHEAVAYSESKDKKDGSVLSVVSNGYKYRGRVLKPALVEIAREEAPSTSQLGVGAKANKEELKVTVTSEEDKLRPES